jgi:hypothetical protein
MSSKPWRCRLGIHKFVVLWNEDNQRYRRCRRCGKDDAGSTTDPAVSLGVALADRVKRDQERP